MLNYPLKFNLLKNFKFNKICFGCYLMPVYEYERFFSGLYVWEQQIESIQQHKKSIHPFYWQIEGKEILLWFSLWDKIKSFSLNSIVVIKTFFFLMVTISTLYDWEKALDPVCYWFMVNDYFHDERRGSI